MAKRLKSIFSLFRSNWFVWLFPLFAIGISAWLFVEYLDERGPMIKISFDDGASIQPDKTYIRFRGVPIGVVKKIEISDDRKSVIAYARLKKAAAVFAVEGSRFWLVAPKVTLQGVSGLETLTEGTYIAVQPGDSGNRIKKYFKGKEDSDTKDPLEDTVSYFLESPNVDSLNDGDSVTFRGLRVGSITKVSLNKTGQLAIVQINVPYKYVRLIRTNTVFWKKVAVQARLGIFKSELKINSFESILHGGVELFTPETPGEIAKAQSKFPLLAAPPKDWEKWNPKLTSD
ncbi:MlaD family protein [Bdellovibrio sp. 22V]|uniref:MlaD family protein n=1 Tax=Bdellovibrio TaxID=958 RepID=UPI0025426C76|nr:MlaD family protein [Bdellovibrio sp. 22V]WII72605.1 MlaD family protein [Bdellovibrio sp. 22V]